MHKKMISISGLAIILGLTGAFLILDKNPNYVQETNSPPIRENRTLDQTEDSIEDEILEKHNEARTEIVADYGYSLEGYLILDIRNIGSISFPVERDDTKLLDLMGGNEKQEWSYISKENQEKDEFTLSVDETVSINTSLPFPEKGGRIILRISGPLKTADSLVCNGGDQTC